MFKNGEYYWSLRNPYAEDLDAVTVYDDIGTEVYSVFSSSTYSAQLSDCTGDVCAFITSDGFVRVNFSASAGEYIVSINATDGFNIPWGSYFNDSHVCYSGDPKIGILGALMTGFDDTTVDVGLDSPDPNCYATTGFVYDQFFDDCDSLSNDVVMMTFERMCSGDRGNICSGDAELSLTSLQSCADLNYSMVGTYDTKEIESCNGPSKAKWYTLYQGYISAEPCTECDPADCINGYCEPIGGMFGCFGYTGTTFEAEFNLKRPHSSTPADGTCNAHPTCGLLEDKYNMDENEGPCLHHNATCGSGACDYPLYTTDCETAYSGRPDDVKYIYPNFSPISTRVCAWETSPQKKHLQSTLFGCGENVGQVYCALDRWEDADYSAALCAACNDADQGPKHSGTWLTIPDR